MSDVEEGLTSNDFNLGENIIDGDARTGLDKAGKREVKKIMKRQHLGFDEARKIYTERRFAKNNIGPDVSFLWLLDFLSLFIADHHRAYRESTAICTVFRMYLLT